MNHLLKYYEECRSQGILPLPILFKVRDRFLTLQGYQLNTGLCASLQAALAIYPEILVGVNLTENGISDGDLAKVLAGLTKLKEFKQFIVKDNQVLSESCIMLAQVLAVEQPDNLEELRLIRIRTSPYITSRICEVLSTGCHLRRLSLVQAGIEGENNVSNLCLAIERAYDLIELDISANKISPSLMVKVLKVLAANRNLQLINLAWNFLTKYYPMKDYCQGVDELNWGNEEQSYISEKEKLINYEGDLASNPSLLNLKVPAFKASQDETRASQGSIDSIASSTQRMPAFAATLR